MAVVASAPSSTAWRTVSAKGRSKAFSSVAKHSSAVHVQTSKARRCLTIRSAALQPDPWSRPRPNQPTPSSSSPAPPSSSPSSSQPSRPTAARSSTTQAQPTSSPSSSSRPSPASTSTDWRSPPPPSPEALLAELSPEEQRTVKLYANSAPSVVNVSIDASAFSPFLMQPVPRGVGSGFIWDQKGHIVTNAHVIGIATEVSVTLSDGTVARGKVVGRDREKDIAVLKILDMSADQLADLRPLPLGSSSNLLVGQRVFALGNPFGLDLALSQGIVSGLGREVGGGVATPWGPLGGGPSITNAIQTDTAINPGNSGGPLLDSNGRCVGINTAMLDPTGRGISSGVGFAISIDSVRGMIDQILTTGRVMRPALGITIAPVPLQFGGGWQQGSLRNDWRRGSVQQAEGVLVVGVQPGGPADSAGVQPTRRELSGRLILGDIITGVGSKTVRQQKDLFTALDGYQVGDSVKLSLLSAAGTSRSVIVTLGDRGKMAGSE